MNHRVFVYWWKEFLGSVLTFFLMPFIPMCFIVLLHPCRLKANQQQGVPLGSQQKSAPGTGSEDSRILGEPGSAQFELRRLSSSKPC